MAHSIEFMMKFSMEIPYISQMYDTMAFLMEIHNSGDTWVCIIRALSYDYLDNELFFIDVRTGAHMFWWMHFTKATGNFTERPLIFWLQGGPGSSSTGYGNFEILGPLDLNEKERNFTWINSHNVSIWCNVHSVTF